MIFGGVNAAGKAGGMRAGRSETYLQCSANFVRREIIDTIEQSTASAVTWRSEARIRNVSNTAWIDLGSASYFQISRDPEGGLDSADLTLQQTEVWSPYLSTYPDLLLPSTRRVQLRAGMVLSGVWYPVIVFSGSINSYSEAIGANGGGISLRLQDARDQFSRVSAATTALTAASSFRMMLVQNSTFSGAYGGQITIRTAFRDQILTSVASATNGSVWAEFEKQFPGFPLMQITGSGSIKASQETTAESQTAQFAYSDKNIHIATRRYSGDLAVNVVRCYGLKAGVATIEEVQDDADVLKRGRVVYPAGLIGQPGMLLTDAQDLGREHIAGSLRGLFDVEIPFNPYLLPGQTISITSTRFGIATSFGKVYKIRHQYAVGRCRTYLTGLRTWIP